MQKSKQNALQNVFRKKRRCRSKRKRIWGKQKEGKGGAKSTAQEWMSSVSKEKRMVKKKKSLLSGGEKRKRKTVERNGGG